MGNNIKISHVRILAGINACVIAASFLAGYFINAASGAANIAENDMRAAELRDLIGEQAENVSSAGEAAVTRIAENTTIIYEYLYDEDGLIDRAEEDSPTILLDMSRSEVERNFADWAIISFTPGEVVLRKTVSGKSGQYYVVGEYDGYIAVFYESEDYGAYLKEITDVPVIGFPTEERERLRAGIHVTGNEELSKILEAYGS